MSSSDTKTPTANTTEEDIFRIKRKLEKMIKTNDIDVSLSTDMLNTLKKLQVDLEILKNTGIGVVLNNLRKSCNSEELGSLAKNLLKDWKKLVSSETAAAPVATSPKSPNSNSNDSLNSQQQQHNNSQSEENNHSKHEKNDSASKPKLNHSVSNSSSSSATSSFKNLRLSVVETSDPVRAKCRELLSQALEVSEPIENGCALYDCNDLAAQIEQAIYAEFKNTEMKYKNRVRSRIANLKDVKNPKLRESVRLGLITAERIAVMTPEEMASDEMKEMRAKFTKEAINDHQMAKAEGSKTSLLACGKCKKNNVYYTQMQTRSADEPMTTFAFCQECGHRWKFC